MTLIKKQRRYAIGILTLFTVVLIWVSSSFLMNNIFDEQQYNKPFAITYINTSSFSLYILFSVFKSKKLFNEQKKRNEELGHTLYETLSRLSSSADSTNSNHDDDNNNVLKTDQSNNVNDNDDDDNGFSNHTRLNRSFQDSRRSSNIDININSLSNIEEDEKLTTREIAKLGFTFCILWFAANWSSNASLAYTNVASSTILSSTSCFFTLGFGSFVGIENFSLIKFMATCISVIGVILISTGDTADSPQDRQPTNPLIGDGLALIGAIFYGCYAVLLKLRIQNESRINMASFFGFVGLFNVLLLWPAFFLLDFLGIEKLQPPPNGRIWAMIIVNALIGTFLSDYLWLMSVLMTSPLVVTLGLSFTIPLALIGDIFFKGIVMHGGYWLGALMILGGFLAVNFITLKENPNRKSQSSPLPQSQLSSSSSSL